MTGKFSSFFIRVSPFIFVWSELSISICSYAKGSHMNVRSSTSRTLSIACFPSMLMKRYPRSSSQRILSRHSSVFPSVHRCLNCPDTSSPWQAKSSEKGQLPKLISLPSCASILNKRLTWNLFSMAFSLNMVESVLTSAFCAGSPSTFSSTRTCMTRSSAIARTTVTWCAEIRSFTSL